MTREWSVLGALVLASALWIVPESGAVRVDRAIRQGVSPLRAAPAGGAWRGWSPVRRIESATDKLKQVGWKAILSGVV
jgi:hypothetical protein